jgi:hypothetical protein
MTANAWILLVVYTLLALALPLGRYMGERDRRPLRLRQSR